MKLSREIEAKLKAATFESEIPHEDYIMACDVRALICDALDAYRNELVDDLNKRWRSGYGEMAQGYSIAADIIEDHIGRERDA